MKRAKQALIAIALVALLVAALAAGVRFWGVHRLEQARLQFEAEVGSTDLAGYILPPLSREENAAVWLRAGAEAVVPAGDSDLIARLSGPDIGAVPAEDLAAGEELMTRNGAAFELLERARGLSESTFGVRYDQGFDAELPPLIELLKAARLIRADGRLALAGGESERLRRDLDILDAMSEALARESFLIASLMGLAIDRLWVATVHDVLTSGQDDASLLQSLERELGQRDRREVLRRSLAAEGAALLAARGGPETIGGMSLGNRISLYLWEPYQLAGLLRLHSDLSRAAEGTWAEARGRFANGSQGRSSTVAKILFPNLLATIDKLQANELARRLAAAAVALRLEVLATGSYPQSLEPTPDDPYAGGSILYERRADGSVLLSAPDAMRLWQQDNSGVVEHQRPPFDWLLPAARLG